MANITTTSTATCTSPHKTLKFAAIRSHARTKSISARHSLLQVDEIPAWMANGPYILRGYRYPLESFRACFWSLFYPHNQLINTWSHLIPAMFFLGILLEADYSTFHQGVQISAGDNFMIRTYVAGTAICCFLSAFYHGCHAHSETVARRCLKFDYLGIVVSITVTSLSSTYFGLYGEPWLQALYMIISALSAIAVVYTLLDPHAHGPNDHLFRVGVFVALSGSAFVPIAHKALVGGVEALQNFPLVQHNSAVVWCYLVGAIFHVSRLPERLLPDTFDIWGSSHQIFHVLVAIGHLVFFFTVTQIMLSFYQ